MGAGAFLRRFFYPPIHHSFILQKENIMNTSTNTLTPEQMEAILEQATRERERLAQENLPRWYHPHSTKS